ncbi:MAG: hypothetical protein JRJ84_05090, partial [Deltaproteobacteria bacterium]|nr:hypothetical protein [Deltaproteobacteria bacterium]
MLLIGIASIAIGAEVAATQDELQAHWDALSDEVVMAASGVLHVENASLDIGPASYTMRDGYVVPLVLEGSERQVGLMFVGEGALQVSFVRASDAQWFANRSVLKAGASEEEMAEVARQQRPWVTEVRRGFVLSTDLTLVRKLGVGAEDSLPEGWDEDADALRKRLDAFESEMHLGSLLRADVVLEQLHGVDTAGSRVLADFDTGHAQRMVDGGARDTWITVSRDLSGSWWRDLETRVMASAKVGGHGPWWASLT